MFFVRAVSARPVVKPLRGLGLRLRRGRRRPIPFTNPFLPINMIDHHTFTRSYLPPPPIRDKTPRRFVNVRFSLRFVMVSVSDPLPDDGIDDEEGVAPDSPGITLSNALADVDMM